VRHLVEFVALTCVVTHFHKGNAMNNLSGCYRQLGRHQDSLVMAEKALEFRRRVLPENHPQIGATNFFSVLI
jgi:hypothetical protein